MRVESHDARWSQYVREMLTFPSALTSHWISSVATAERASHSQLDFPLVPYRRERPKLNLRR